MRLRLQQLVAVRAHGGEHEHAPWRDPVGRRQDRREAFEEDLGFGRAVRIEQFLGLVDREDDGRARRLLVKADEPAFRQCREIVELPAEAIFGELALDAADRALLAQPLEGGGERNGRNDTSSRASRGQSPARRNEDLPEPEEPSTTMTFSTPPSTRPRMRSRPRTIIASRPK